MLHVSFDFCCKSSLGPVDSSRLFLDHLVLDLRLEASAAAEY